VDSLVASPRTVVLILASAKTLGSKQQRQFALHFIDDRTPIAAITLPEEPHRWIPGGIRTIGHLAPVGSPGEDGPDGFGERPGEVGDGGIHRDHQVQIHDDRSNVFE